MPMKIGETNYTTFEDLWNDSILTPDEKANIQLKVELMGKLIEAREKRGLTQKALADLCGVKQPFIARMEKGDTDPQITTLLKILQPLGYTLTIVPISEAQPKLQ
jgi:DNA-binding XRE family transcriptional regulator